MTAEQLQHMQHVCKRPGMYMPSGTLENVFAYLEGMDASTGCLTGFREWLVTKVNAGNNLIWEGLLDFLYEQEACAEHAKLDRLSEILCEFYELTHPEGRHDLLRIYIRYHAWMLNQSFYKPGWPGYVPPYDGLPVPNHR